MSETIKVKCSECDVLLNIKNLDKHMYKVHYKNKEDLYRKLEEIKEIVRDTTDPQDLKLLKSQYDKLKLAQLQNRYSQLVQKVPIQTQTPKSFGPFKNCSLSMPTVLKRIRRNIKIDESSHLKYKESISIMLNNLQYHMLSCYDLRMGNKEEELSVPYSRNSISIKVLEDEKFHYSHYRKILKTLIQSNDTIDMSSRLRYKESIELILEAFQKYLLLAYDNHVNDLTMESENVGQNVGEIIVDKNIEYESKEHSPKQNNKFIITGNIPEYKGEVAQEDEKFDPNVIIDVTQTQIISQEPIDNILDNETYWEENSPIKESTTIDNVLKHQSDTFQYNDDEELDPDMIIDEEEYQEEFINNLSNNKVNIVQTKRVVFQKSVVDKEEKDLKSDIKIFLSKMYKGYCQVCGFTFKKLNGDNSFEMFNWNDKRVVKIKKSFISTADSLCLCRNCSANIKWGAFKPLFIDNIKSIKDFQDKKSDEIKIILHNLVDAEVPNIFKSFLEFNDMYALEIELRKEPRNIYFTNEHLLQFIAYLQTEDEIEEELLFKKTKRKINEVSNRIYSNNTWLRREETIPESLARDFVRNTAWWDHPKAYRYVRANHSHRVKKDYRHGWAIKFGANQFLVGKAIERCKDEINKYIEQLVKGNKMDFNTLKEKLRKHISGAVATGNNYEYNGYYPIQNGYMKFGVQAINVDDGVNFLIRELGLNEFIGNVRKNHVEFIEV